MYVKGIISLHYKFLTDKKKQTNSVRKLEKGYEKNAQKKQMK